jgi:hypothetical protein
VLIKTYTMANLTTIPDLIKEHHNLGLVDTKKAPNGNNLYLLFNDGEICSTKGGSAFMSRTLFTRDYPLENVNIPMPRKMVNNGSSYAILPSYEIAQSIRGEMAKSSSK